MQAVTKGVPFALHQGYSTLAAAQAAFDVAHANHWTCALAGWLPLLHVPAAPQPLAHEPRVHEVLLCTQETNAPWYVVYSGVNPGVFATQ